MDELSADPPAVNVLDVLGMVPLDVVDTRVWHTLKRHGFSGRSLRQTSQQGRRLVDQLSTFAAYSLWGDGSHIIGKVGSQEAVQDSSIERWAAFLARLPRVKSLLLSHTSGSPHQQQPIRDAPLVAALVHSGVATQGRVRVLTLECTALPLTTACAARLAHPGLEELHILPPSGYPLTTLRLNCRPWYDSAISKVVLGDWGRPDTATVVDLCGLSRLQHLEMTVDDLADLQHLTRLTNLQYLSLRSTHGRPAVHVSHVACVFSLTRLTHLELLTGMHIVDDQATSAAPDATCTAIGQLQQLSSLRLCLHYVVHDSLFAGLVQLTHLTSLSIGRAEVSGWRDGHLPMLQRLKTAGLSPTSLLQVLTPLLPLPSLNHLSAYFDSPNVFMPDCCAALDISIVDGPDAEAQERALKLLAQHLAAAPQLHLRKLLLGVCDPQRRPGPPVSGQMSLTQVGHGLRPLGAFLTSLQLLGLALDDQGWDVLATALPRLDELTVMCGSLTDVGLAAIGGRLCSLEHLVVQICGMNVLEACNAWLGLAAARAGPLRVTASVSQQLQSQCAAVQLRQHGRSTLVWRPVYE